ncbi:MAG: hypothetical protein FWD61_06795 [Phycisphaerales bacterium]|nr:hypothetical protein [Phycisphaerales bacterium]
MNNDNVQSITDRLICITENTDVIPHTLTDPPAFEPFGLPPLPLSQGSWLSALGTLFRRKYRRCLALHLILDCQARRWVNPIIPTQRCGPTSPTWSILEKDLTHLPASTRIGGSFQTGRADDINEIKARIPPYDGIHCFLKIERHLFTKFWMVRAGDQLDVIPPEFIVVDDWLQFIIANYDRFEFCSQP